MKGSEAEVRGTVADGFEAVRDVFADRLSDLGEGGAAFAAVVRGRPVVDLWAGYAGASPWRRDTRGALSGMTKGIAAVAVAWLHDQGLIDVAHPVAKYWPEFAAGGKEEVTVAHVLSHSAGLPTVPRYDEVFGTNGQGFEQTAEILQRLAAAPPSWRPGTVHGYHGLTYGWLVGEIVRRAAGVSVGHVVQKHIAAPLDLDLDLGTPVERQHRVAPVIPYPPMRAGTYDLTQYFKSLSFAVNGHGFMNYYHVMLNDPAYAAMEFPSFNATGTTRAVAKLYGELANADRDRKVRLLTQDTVQLFAAEYGRGVDPADGIDKRWGLGFQLREPARADALDSWGPHDESFGFNGGGGQVAFADPVSEVGACFVRSHHSWHSAVGGTLVDALYECLKGV